MNNLQLKIVLNGVDKVSKPLQNAMGGAKELAQQLKETRDRFTQLNNVQKNVDGFTKLKKQFEDAKKATKDLSIQLKQTENPTKELQKAFNKAREDTKKLKDQLNPLRSELQKSGISTKNLAQYQISLKSKINSANKSIEQQSARLKTLNQHQQRMNQIRSKYDTGMQRVAIMGGVGYGALSTGRTVARGMKNLLNVGYEFDASMSATQAVTRIDDKNDPRMLALRQQARTLPLTSKFTDSEVAAGQYFLGRTGYDADQIQKAMPHMLNLAAAGDMDLGTTADIASNIQKAMRIPAEEMGQVSDILTAAFTRNNVDIPMLGESLKYTAGLANQYGQSLETLTTATSLLGNAGIQGSQAGTSLRQVLIRIGDSSAVKKLGVKTADKNGNMRDLGVIFEEIQKATAHMGNLQRAAIYKQIAGQIGVTGFNELMATVETGEFQAMRHNLYNSKGEAEKVAKIKLDNLKGDMTMLHAAFENISVELFEKNNEWLRKAVQGFTHFLHSVGEFLKKHPALSKALVMLGSGLAVVTTAFGGLAILLMSVFGPMLMTRFILSKIGLSLGGLLTKTGIAGGGFKTLGSTLLTIATSPVKILCMAFKSLGAIFTAISRVFLLNPIGIAISLIVGAALAIRKYWEPVSAFFIGFWEGLNTALEPVFEIFSFMGPVFDAIGDAISDVIDWFSDLFEPIHLTSDEFNSAKSSGVSFGTTIGNIIMFPIKLFKQLYNLVKKVWDLILSLPEKIKDLPNKISAIFKNKDGLFNNIKNFGSDIVDGVSTGITNQMDSLKKNVSKVTDGITGWFKDELGIHSPSRLFADYGAYTIEGYQIGIERNQNDAIRTIGSFANKVGTVGSQINGGVIVDQRKPISSIPVSSSAPMPSFSPQFNITIHAASGMSEHEIASKVVQELDRRERQQQTRFRSSLRDID